MSGSVVQLRSRMPSPFRAELMIGAASPLWAYFAGAAMAGMGWWWMMRWMRPAELEAMLEAAAEPALEALAEATGGSVAEALVGDKIPALPVGGESGPFSSAVLEAELIEKPELATELSQEADMAPEERPAPPRARKPREGEPKPH